MRLKTYQAYTMAEALAAVKGDLGDDAVILNTRTFQRGGLLGIGRKTIVEVTATPAADAAAAARAEDATPRARQTQAQRAYADRKSVAGANGRPPAVIEARQMTDASSSVLRTRRLAMAMEEKMRRAEAAAPQPSQPAAAARPQPQPPAAKAPLIETAAVQVAVGTPVAAKASSAPGMSPTIPLAPVNGPATPMQSAARRFVMSPADGSGRIVLSEPKPRASEAKAESERHEGTSNGSSSTSGPRNGNGVVSIAAPPRSHEAPPVEVVAAPGSQPGSSPVLARRSIVEMKPIAPASEPAADMQEELAAIKALVSKVLERQAMDPVASAAASMPAALFEMYLAMVRQEISNELADHVVRQVRAELGDAAMDDPAMVRPCAVKHLASMIPVAPIQAMERPADGRPLTIALVGPTGVGKTTTLAKLAATFKLRLDKNVGLITCDTYRIAAVDQLRTYADIIGLPLEVVLSPEEMERSLRNMAGCDVILIDTAGRSQNDSGRIRELRGFVAAAAPHQVHLVLSGTASQRVLLQEASAFAEVGVQKVVLTKLDEAVSFGMLVNVIRQVGKELSFFTTGQEVPDHLEIGKAERLAALVLGDRVHS